MLLQDGCRPHSEPHIGLNAGFKYLMLFGVRVWFDLALSRCRFVRSTCYLRIAESVGEILKGIRGYFDKALPAMLLYKRERQQYQEAVADGASPSTVYGAEHLLRLFVKLPELLAYVNMEEETLSQLQQKLHDFLKFLQKNQNTFFLSAYESLKVLEDPDEE